MATEVKLEQHNPFDLKVPSGKGLRIGIAVAEWNGHVTHSLLDGAKETLIRYGVNINDIVVWQVPGTFELVNASARLMRMNGIDAVIALGCVVRGDTPHFDYICQGVSVALANLNMGLHKNITEYYDQPVVFGVLTTDTMAQAEERAGGRLGNKGSDAAEVAIKMCNLHK